MKSDILKNEVFFSATANLSDIPDTFFASLNDAMEDAVKHHKKYIIRCTQSYELMIELEDLSKNVETTNN